MDFDGFRLLMDRDFKKFTTWHENSGKLSLEELRKNYNEWHEKMHDAIDKYGNYKSDAEKKRHVFVHGQVYVLFLPYGVLPEFSACLYGQTA